MEQRNSIIIQVLIIKSYEPIKNPNNSIIVRIPEDILSFKSLAAPKEIDCSSMIPK